MTQLFNSVIILEWIFQGFCLYNYFCAVFHSKQNKNFILILFLITSYIEYLVNYAFHYPLLNILFLLLMIFQICIISYAADWKKILLHTLISAALIIISDLSTILINNSINILPEKNEGIYEFVITAFSKMILFTICILIKLILQKDIKIQKSIWLLSVPLFSIILINGIFMLFVISVYREPSMYNKDAASMNMISLILCFVSVMVINAVIFHVHDNYVETFKETERLKLLEQKKKLDYEYYKVLQNNYNESRIIIHDFKHHIDVLRALSESEDNDAVKKYLVSLNNTNTAPETKMTGNRIVDIIIHHKWEQCSKQGIKFIFHTNNIDFDFMEESDICCILSNLLDNCTESAVKSKEKLVKLEFFSNDDDDLYFIETENSCDTAPTKLYGRFITSKKDTNRHGIGLLSIEKTVKKYNGGMEQKYIEDKKIFKSSVMLHKQ